MYYVPVTGDQVIEEGEYLKSGKVFSRAGSTALSKGSESEGSRCFLQDEEMISCNFFGSSCIPATSQEWLVPNQQLTWNCETAWILLLEFMSYHLTQVVLLYKFRDACTYQIFQVTPSSNMHEEI
jgi:hypothetical protein